MSLRLRRSFAAALLIFTLGCEEKLPLPAGDLGVASGGSRLRPRFLASDDARAFLHFVDTELQTPCMFRVTQDGLRCLPLAFGRLSFTEASCTRAVLPAYQPSYITTKDAVYRVGELVEAPAIFVKDGDECVASAEVESSWRAVEEKVSFSDFVEGRQREIDPDGRLTRLGVVGTDGSWAPGGWFDRELEVECDRASETGLCEPTFSTGDIVGDRYCSGEVFVTDGPVQGYVCASLPASHRASCVELPQVTLRRVLDPIPLDEIEVEGPADGCEPFQAEGGIDRAFQVGDPLDPLAVLEPLDLSRVGPGSIVASSAQSADGRTHPPSLVQGRSGSETFTLLEEAFGLADGSACVPTQIGDRIRCVPAAGFVYRAPARFADSGCTEAAVWVEEGEVILTGLEDASNLPGLYAAGAVHALGDEVPLDSLYRFYDGTCRRIPNPWCATYRRLGALVDATIYPELEVITE